MAGALSDDTEARPPVDHDPVEVPFAPLDPRVRTAWWLEAAAGSPTISTIVAGAAICAGLVPVIRYRRWRYALRADDLWLRFGVLRTTVSVIPFSRLQFVDTRQG